MTKPNKTYRSDALRSAHLAMSDLHAVGAVDKQTMRRFDAACLTTVRPFDAAEIRQLREASEMSQAVFAKVLNVSTSALSQWEQGEKKPSGPSLKLLSLIHAKGVDAVL
ncbi:DNA-binding transcriptional regulator [Fulvimarina sp. MAC8]|uniref:helix-turn-helix domain-containing protein n=1 Tax=Fulvimarina sp. MAC8 TaxID=3162874 RepID=UPI0032EDB426